jgi:hypothetical protein
MPSAGKPAGRLPKREGSLVKWKFVWILNSGIIFFIRGISFLSIFIKKMFPPDEDKYF